MNLLTELQNTFDACSNKYALYINKQHYTYGEVWRYSSFIKNLIVSSSSESVGILAGHDLASYVTTLACVRSGKAFVPLNPKFPEGRLTYIIEAANISIVIFDTQYLKIVNKIKELLPHVKFVEFTSIDNQIPSKNHAEIQIVAHDFAYVLFTSGSTGHPKGVPISINSLEGYLAYMVPYCGLNEQDICSQFFDTSFDLSIHDIFVTWLSGACLAVLPESASLAPGSFIKRIGITCWFSVPSILTIMAKLGQLKANAYPTIRKSFFCGEALLSEQVEKWFSACPNTSVVNLYGPTEATIACAHFEVEKGKTVPAVIPIGTPFPHMTFEQTENGELMIAGSQLTAGYLNLAEKNAESFISKSGQRFYFSGDVVDIDEDFGFIYLGRKDEQVKIQGFRVELKEIEVAAVSSGKFNFAKAAIEELDGLGKRIILFIDGAADNSVINKLSEQLPNYMLPSEVIFVDSMPLNVNGKVDVNELLCNWRKNAYSK